MNQIPLRVICCDLYFPSGCLGNCICGTPFPPPLERRVRSWGVVPYTSSQYRNPREINLLELANGSMRQKARCALLKKELETLWSRMRQNARCALLKEDLMAEVWKPSRVEKLL